MTKPFWATLRDRIDADPNLKAAPLAKAAGLADSTIRHMIRDEREPTLKTARKICDALNTTYEDFMASDGATGAMVKSHFAEDEQGYQGRAERTPTAPAPNDVMVQACDGRLIIQANIGKNGIESLKRMIAAWEDFVTDD